LLIGAGAAAFAVSRIAAAQDKKEGSDHKHHHHGGGGKNAALVGAAHDCVLKGDICLEHCLEMMATGDTSLALCAVRVRELIASCGALATLAAYDNRHLKEFAAVTKQICEDCRAECLKHEQHQQCADCAESCAGCIKECEALIG
jgi:Cys-rich four helix bundle protein (predicted Tat secretion target)